MSKQKWINLVSVYSIIYTVIWKNGRGIFKAASSMSGQSRSFKAKLKAAPIWKFLSTGPPRHVIMT